MDTHVKEGQLYVQHQKFGKKWKKSWFVLYPASQNGIARLEFYDSSGSANDKPNTKKMDKKIIRLAECISILPAVTETCPKDNMSAFCVETNDKTHVFAAEKYVTSEWVEKLCEISFQGGCGSLGSPDSNGQQELQMAENLIYYSREEVNEFWVSVQWTEASERCDLSGNFWLKANADSLVLKDPKSKKDVFVWPYKLLRRYGRDRVMFSFEAGRRCESGPGNFTFETKQGNEIFRIVEESIREQKAQAEERHQSCSSFDSDSPILQQLRAAFSDASSREPDGDSGGSKPGSADGVFGQKENSGKNVKARILPDPLPPVGGTPPRSPIHHASKNQIEDQVSLYSEPADSVRSLPCPGDRLYSDPIDSIKSMFNPNPRIRPTGDEGCSWNPNIKPQPFNSDIYDQISQDLQRTIVLGLEARGRYPADGGQTEPIYDEPEGCAASSQPVITVYDEARLDLHPSRTRGTEEPQNQKVVQQPQPMPRSKAPKPVTAPKPNKVAKHKKDPPPLPHIKGSANLNNNNSSKRFDNMEVGRRGAGGGNSMDLYSKVSRHEKPSHECNASLPSPDIIYDNFSDI
ncbi:hypothetical protein DNTS_033834 [Danionella cerebrum]|uniref:IRS-type PTB domain-containing protein n=1 Tax=Danionella cerebrum TaxID=2873325 RepID=A0A553QPX4_9TELE|nr:hypothetical protein DNTS_033834 [Danionella translucida]